MLNITPITNYQNNINFKAKSDYSKIYKEMGKISLNKDEKIIPKDVAKKGMFAAAIALFSGLFITKKKDNIKVEKVTAFNNSQMSKGNILKPIDNNGNTFAHTATYEEWKQIYQIYKKDPDMLVKIYTAKNKEGSFPAHNFGKYGITSDNYKYQKEKFEIMNNALKGNIDALKTIYLTKNNDGARTIDYGIVKGGNRHMVYKLLESNEKLIQHLIFDTDERGHFIETDVDTVIKYLKSRPDLLAKYFLSKNNPNGNINLGVLWSTGDFNTGQYTVERMNKIHKALKAQPNVLYDIYMTPQRHYDSYREEYYTTTMTPKNHYGNADEKYGKEYLSNIIDLAQNPKITPRKARTMLQYYHSDAYYAGLEKEFDKLIRYFQTIEYQNKNNSDSAA